ncbi:MAG: hypothetical protein CVU11_05365 [Bacteroidetes bacterium HGW-Bacteroidetes-6]|jgi:gliding motility-associated-like protein|nr:MAG: hypothetical protein CVU11_05365 [Bacteroidetes bacterium HGW-Bacteroidetes-6]
MNKLIKSLLSLVVCLVLSKAAIAQTFVQPCIADTRVAINDACPAWQTTNYGASTTILATTWTWNAVSCGQGNMRSLLQFDINPATSPQALYDNRATLNLYFPTGSTETQFYTGAATDNQFYVQQVTGNWSELGVNWNTQPTITATGQITVPSCSPNPSSQDYTVNVSTLVYNWICNGATNYGFRLQQVNEGNTYRRVNFCSREYATASKHPTLTLEYAYIAASAPDTMCGGGSFNLNCSLTNASNPAGYSFQWLHQNSGTTYNTQNVSNPNTTSGLNTYIVTVTNPWCQTARDTVTVFIDNSAAISVSPSSANICQGGSTTLVASGASTYSWDNSLGSGAYQTVSPSSNTTYTVTGTTAAGCTSSASVTVSLLAAPTISVLASPTAVCPGNSSTLTSSGGSTYAWSTGGTGTTTIVNPTASTAYTVTGTSVAGCTATASVNVTVLAGPVVVAIGDTICIGASANLLATGATNYAWDNSMTGSSISVSPTSTTTYTVSGTDGSGCTGLATATVLVNPLPTVSVNQPSICIGTTASLTASGASSYVWSTSDFTASIQVTPLATTSYDVTGTDANGCVNSALAVVTVNPLPSIFFISTSDYCESGNGTATASGSIGLAPYSYLWNTSETTPTISGLSVGQYTVTITDANGCTADSSVTIVPEEGFTLTALSTDENCNQMDGTAEIVPANASYPLVYSWSHNPALNSANAIGLGAGVYTVTATDGQCTRTVDVEVGFFSVPDTGFIVPNIVTPNGDGFNDQLCFGTLLSGQFNIIVYNRWGKMLYESDNFNECWDLYFEGKPLDDGTYFYVARFRSVCSEETKEVNGIITVIAGN